MFYITHEDLDVLKAEKKNLDPRAGGVVHFEGRVRNHNDSKEVKFLEYEAYEDLANLEGSRIIAEAKEKFEVYDLLCVHRVGKLELTDMAVWVVALSAHRREAFLACQYVIDEVKKRVPVWKKEHYVNEVPQWVACHRCSEDAHEHV